MKVAITGGTGLVGSHLARKLVRSGHDVVLISRGTDRRDLSVRAIDRARFVAADIRDEGGLAEAFAGCESVAHCAGINRETRRHSYQRVHVEGTRSVVRAARRAGVKKVVLVSFLRARPHCGSPYHESKWAAEEIVRTSGIDYTVIKPGVIYGRTDHMLDHLSHAFHTFPLFALVGLRDRRMRPMAIEDMSRVLEASLVDGELSGMTVAVMGPEELSMREAVERVARVVGKRPIMFPMPVVFHRLFGWVCERLMTTPLISLAQVRILEEGLTEPLPPCEPLPNHLQPRRSFSDDQILAGLPAPGPFRLGDLRCFASGHAKA